MRAVPETPPRTRPGDTITVTGTVRKVWGPGPHLALVDTEFGSFTVPLPRDGELPDSGIVISHAPAPAVEHHVGGTS